MKSLSAKLQKLGLNRSDKKQKSSPKASKVGEKINQFYELVQNSI